MRLLKDAIIGFAIGGIVAFTCQAAGALEAQRDYIEINPLDPGEVRVYESTPDGGWIATNPLDPNDVRIIIPQHGRIYDHGRTDYDKR